MVVEKDGALANLSMRPTGEKLLSRIRWDTATRKGSIQRVDVKRRHEHEVRGGKVGTARCARAGQPTTR